MAVRYFHVRIVNQTGFSHPSVNAVIKTVGDKPPSQEKFLESLDKEDREAIEGWISEGQRLEFRPRVFNDLGVMIL